MEVIKQWCEFLKTAEVPDSTGDPKSPSEVGAAVKSVTQIKDDLAISVFEWELLGNLKFNELDCVRKAADLLGIGSLKDSTTKMLSGRKE